MPTTRPYFNDVLTVEPLEFWVILSPLGRGGYIQWTRHNGDVVSSNRCVRPSLRQAAVELEGEGNHAAKDQEGIQANQK
jgi:hypothetical protein